MTDIIGPRHRSIKLIERAFETWCRDAEQLVQLIKDLPHDEAVAVLMRNQLAFQEQVRAETIRELERGTVQ